MEWTAEKLIEFMGTFRISAREMAKETGLHMSTIYAMKYDVTKLQQASGLLTAYCNAKKASAVAYHRAMIEYFENI